MRRDSTYAILLRPLVDRALRAVLLEELGRQGVETVRAEIWRRFESGSGSLPDQGSAGASIMVRVAALTVALYRVLLEEGLPRRKAQELTAEVSWRVIRRLAAVSWEGAKPARGRDPMGRVRHLMHLLMRFPYGEPGYTTHQPESGETSAVFQVQHCPVAAHFAQEDLAELCGTTFCDIEVRLADEWGVELERPRTLGQGGTRCSFCFRPAPDAPAEHSPAERAAGPRV